MCGAYSSKYGNRFLLLRVEKGKLTKIPDFFLEKSQEINSNKRIHSFTYAKLRMTNHLAITRFLGERVNILRLLNSRGEALGAGRLLILDQNEAQRAKKKFFGDQVKSVETQTIKPEKHHCLLPHYLRPKIIIKH